MQKQLITQFTIYGERNSGTNFLEKIIERNFDIPATWEFGWKHFFGWKSKEISNDTKTLFLGLVRNPYDWIMALNRTKHHIPMSNHGDITQLLLNEWYSINKTYPMHITDINGIRKMVKQNARTCVHKIESRFHKEKEVLEDRNWKNGNRYHNIFELRKNKLEYLTEVMPKLTDRFVLLRYEDLLSACDETLRNIANKFDFDDSFPYVSAEAKTGYSVRNSIKRIINTNINWETEKKCGYKKRP